MVLQKNGRGLGKIRSEFREAELVLVSFLTEFTRASGARARIQIIYYLTRMLTMQFRVFLNFLLT